MKSLNKNFDKVAKLFCCTIRLFCQNSFLTSTERFLTHNSCSATQGVFNYFYNYH